MKDWESDSPITRVLNNVDLLRIIFPQLSPFPTLALWPHTNLSHQYRDKLAQQTLARAARACKTFTSPAIDVLWRSMDSLLPLWAVLLPERWRQLKTIDQTTHMLASEIPVEKWSRFHEYAFRIQEAHYAPTTLDEYLQRSIESGLTCILPRIRSLSYVHASPSSTYLPSLVSPTLKVLDITHYAAIADTEADILDMLVRAVCMQAPGVESLRLVSHTRPKPLRTIVTQLTNLRTLELTFTATVEDAETLAALAALPHLHTLHSFSFAPLQTWVPVKGFSSLKDLSFDTDRCNIELLLDCITSPLERLSIISYGMNDMQSAYLYIARHMGDHLKKLSLFLKPQGDVLEVSLLDFVQPLLQIRGLEEFKLDLIGARIVASNADFEAIASAWPRLVSFSLGGPAYQPSPTAATLTAFSARCPSLHTLLISNYRRGGVMLSLENVGSSI